MSDKKKFIYDNSNTDLLSIHDAIFTGFHYDSNKHCITFEALGEWEYRWFSVSFHSVLSFSVYCCDPWTKSDRINGWIISRDQKETSQIIEFSKFKAKSIRGENIERVFVNPSKTIEVLIEFISGNEMRVVCEKVFVETRANEKK